MKIGFCHVHSSFYYMCVYVCVCGGSTGCIQFYSHMQNSLFTWEDMITHKVLAARTED